MKVNLKHKIVDDIRKEIINNINEKYIGIYNISLSSSICSSDLYGDKCYVNKISKYFNISFYYEEKTNERPKILKYENGFNYYHFNTNKCIRLKTFLKKYPQYSNILDWLIDERKKKKVKYMYHDLKNNYICFELPNHTNIKKYFKNKKIPNNFKDINILIEKLTKQYYRKKKFDNINNIKKNLKIYLNGYWLFFNYYDGVVEFFKVYKYTKLKTFNKKISNIIRNNNKILKKEIEEEFDNFIVKSIKIKKY